MPLPHEFDHHLVNLAHDTHRDAGLAPERAQAEAAVLLTALRYEVEDALSHGIDNAEIIERAETMAHMHRFVATGEMRSTPR